MLKMLESLGLKRLDAKVYVYLVHYGSQKVEDIAEVLEIYKWQLYRSLKNLKLKGMISVGQDRPALFSAVSFDKVLDSFIISNREAAQYIEQNKDRILAVWRFKVAADIDV